MECHHVTDPGTICSTRTHSTRDLERFSTASQGSAAHRNADRHVVGEADVHLPLDCLRLRLPAGDDHEDRSYRNQLS